MQRRSRGAERHSAWQRSGPLPPVGAPVPRRRRRASRQASPAATMRRARPRSRPWPDQVRPRRRRRPAVPTAVHVAVGVATSNALWDVDQRALYSRAADREWLESNARTRLRRARVRPAEPAHGDGHRAGRRHRDGGRRASSDPGGAAHAERGQGRVTGNGRADKAQVRRWSSACCSWTSSRVRPTPRDALALAVCHLWRPAGALGAPQRAPGSLTAAQRAWATAEQAARRRG